jgi:hypothetical protein
MTEPPNRPLRNRPTDPTDRCRPRRARFADVRGRAAPYRLHARRSSRHTGRCGDAMDIKVGGRKLPDLQYARPAVLT